MLLWAVYFCKAWGKLGNAEKEAIIAKFAEQKADNVSQLKDYVNEFNERNGKRYTTEVNAIAYEIDNDDLNLASLVGKFNALFNKIIKNNDTKAFFKDTFDADVVSTDNNFFLDSIKEDPMRSKCVFSQPFVNLLASYKNARLMIEQYTEVQLIQQDTILGFNAFHLASALKYAAKRSGAVVEYNIDILHKIADGFNGKYIESHKQAVVEARNQVSALVGEVLPLPPARAQQPPQNNVRLTTSLLSRHILKFISNFISGVITGGYLANKLISYAYHNTRRSYHYGSSDSQTALSLGIATVISTPFLYAFDFSTALNAFYNLGIASQRNSTNRDNTELNISLNPKLDRFLKTASILGCTCLTWSTSSHNRVLTAIAAVPLIWNLMEFSNDIIKKVVSNIRIPNSAPQDPAQFITSFADRIRSDNAGAAELQPVQ